MNAQHKGSHTECAKAEWCRIRGIVAKKNVVYVVLFHVIHQVIPGRIAPDSSGLIFQNSLEASVPGRMGENNLVHHDRVRSYRYGATPWGDAPIQYFVVHL